MTTHHPTIEEFAAAIAKLAQMVIDIHNKSISESQRIDASGAQHGKETGAERARIGA